MTTSTIERRDLAGSLAALRRAGNPFRNYFARNPDDETCARFHVPELYAGEREQLLAVVDLYRADPNTHSEVIPILGNKGTGKTHLLHTIKHSTGDSRQLLVAPGVYQRDTEFLEYLLYQLVDTLLGGGRQRGVRPIESIGDALCRRILSKAIPELTATEKDRLFPPTGLGRWARALGFGGLSGEERARKLAAALAAPTPGPVAPRCLRLLQEGGLAAADAFEIASAQINKTETHNTAGLMRRAIYRGFCKATLLGDEGELALFLTNGFAELPFNVRPSRQDLVLALFKATMEVFRGLQMPVVVAFDQLEDLLLARRGDDGPRIAEAFFAGLVQAMHQLEGICFLVFAERGLWNRFVPSLDGYIQDRLNNPVHVPEYGTIQALRLEAPPVDLVFQVVETRLRGVLAQIPDAVGLPPIYPFTEEQIVRIAKSESTLRDMLIQFRHLFDTLVYDKGELPEVAPAAEELGNLIQQITEPPPSMYETVVETEVEAPLAVREVAVVEVELPPPLPMPTPSLTPEGLAELWEQERRAARRKLEPEGALQGSIRDLQSGLGELLSFCHEHGVKVGPWRLQHVAPEWNFGEHPTYGTLTLAHWTCKDGQPWKVGIGLFLARAGGKPKDLEVKLAAFDVEPAVLDHLILLRPDDDLALSGKSKAMWADAERRGRHARIEAIGIDGFALIASFPRWLSVIRDALAEGQPMPSLAGIIQDKCDRLLEQVCMPM
ncbi:MAG: hypothetical protein K1X57_16005 [Gemmataceae bacterium]|nr:hypothetical protein [Gemmataceae bacterium]